MLMGKQLSVFKFCYMKIKRKKREIKKAGDPAFTLLAYQF